MNAVGVVCPAEAEPDAPEQSSGSTEIAAPASRRALAIVRLPVAALALGRFDGHAADAASQTTTARGSVEVRSALPTAARRPREDRGGCSDRVVLSAVGGAWVGHRDGGPGGVGSVQCCPQSPRAGRIAAFTRRAGRR